MYEYLDIYKIYENHIKSYMICSFLSEQYKTNFQVEKDSIDIDALDKVLSNKLASSDCDITIVEGHLTHLLSNPDFVIILRVNPEVLESRLAKRDYTSLKIKENLEAEALAVCSCEAFDIHTDKVHEIDVTSKSIEEVANISFKAQLNQVNLSKTDYADILTNQCEIVKDCQRKMKDALEALRLAKEKSDNHISKVNLKDTELVSFLRKNNISEKDAQEIIDYLNDEVPVGAGFLTSFNYKIGEEMFHDIYFFQVSK